MRIAAHLGVMDERELIERTVSHLWAIGVDQIIACDMGSTDGTAEFLDELRSDRLSVIHASNSDSSAAWRERNLDAIKRAPVDWVMVLDADEYWLPATGSIKDCAALNRADVITIERFNVPLCDTGPCIHAELAPEHYGEVLLYVDPIANFREYIRTNPDVSWSRSVPMPRVMARRECIGSFTPGMHDVIPRGPEPLRRERADDVTVAHVPFSSFSRFQKKVRNIRQVLAHHDEYASGRSGWHWLRWVSLDDLGLLEEEYRRQIVSSEELHQLMNSGVVRSATQWLQRKAAVTAGV